jgi:hypothetical protein
VVATAALSTGCGEVVPGTPQKPRPPVDGSFVGMARGGPPAVAVVADAPRREGQPRKVSAYVCDGLKINEWLTARSPGNRVALTSEDGRTTARVTLTKDAAKGTIRLAYGRRRGFTAEPAGGLAGLYDVTQAPDASLTGASRAGGRLTGRVGAPTSARLVRPVSGTVTAADGTRFDLTAYARRATTGGYRLIVLPDGRVYGGQKEGGTGFYEPERPTRSAAAAR